MLEIGDDSYTRQFGGKRVSHSDVLHVKEGAPGATIIGDLSNAPQIADDSFDYLILTQVLVVIFDLPATIATIHRILKTGGVALITVPGISNIDKDEWHDQWMWSFTPNSLRRRLQLHFKAEGITVRHTGSPRAVPGRSRSWRCRWPRACSMPAWSGWSRWAWA